MSCPCGAPRRHARPMRPRRRGLILPGTTGERISRRATAHGLLEAGQDLDAITEAGLVRRAPCGVALRRDACVGGSPEREEGRIENGEEEGGGRKPPGHHNPPVTPP